MIFLPYQPTGSHADLEAIREGRKPTDRTYLDDDLPVYEGDHVDILIRNSALIRIDMKVVPFRGTWACENANEFYPFPFIAIFRRGRKKHA